MVALSVSISAKISPSSTDSPTFFNQVATVPSVIVSLKRGIVITCTPAGMLTASDFAAGVVVGVSVTVSVVSSFVGAAAPLISAEMSSPSSPIIASSTSTGDVSPS